ncbi:hypothetical protein LVJ94_21975 [Pendulispora rubella]|uniref:HEXXH motif domain-containing protein n=1 Tax=Pendulispora rubella TaxID=2741070 RepID=A0ABZ2LJ78_9BACT
MATGNARWMLSQEARAMLNRLDRVHSLMLAETMVPAAAPSAAALLAIDGFLASGRRALRSRIRRYLAWLASDAGRATRIEDAHRNFTFLRLRFNAVLTQFDIFSEAMSQRSEARTGVWLAALDFAARDALTLPGWPEPPPVLCYLARDMGGAIRRARTRLPGGGRNPVAIVRLPRERMLGSGIASSLVHEIGHQAAGLFDLLPPLRATLAPHARDSAVESRIWQSWRRWISEIFSDFWAVARVGATSTLGLMTLVSLPRAFVFRANVDDPHPTPWIRVKVSCAMGDALYPHPQWQALARLWESYYPMTDLPFEQRGWLRVLEASIPRFLGRLLEHRAESLGRVRLGDALRQADRHPSHLSELCRRWRRAPELVKHASPCLVFAVLGQGRLDGTVTPEEEGNVLAGLLDHWAITATTTRAATEMRRAI